MTPSSDDPNADDSTAWEGGWDDHRRRQFQRWAKLPFEKKLEWLEEAHDLVRHMQAARESSSKPIPKDR